MGPFNPGIVIKDFFFAKIGCLVILDIGISIVIYNASFPNCTTGVHIISLVSFRTTRISADDYLVPKETNVSYWLLSASQEAENAIFSGPTNIGPAFLGKIWPI